MDFRNSLLKEIIKELWNAMSLRIRYTLFFCLGIGCVLIPWLMSCSHLKKYPQDNIVEEIAEEALEHYTGIKIDLTPSSPEKN